MLLEMLYFELFYVAGARTLTYAVSCVQHKLGLINVERLQLLLLNYKCCSS